MQIKNPARRRMRIQAVFAEWARTPLLLGLPLLTLVLGLMADGAAEAGFFAAASALALLSHASIVVLLGLLLVAFLRL